MRIAIAGLDSFFFSTTFPAKLRGIQGVQLAGCTALGTDDAEIRANIGMSAAEYAERERLALHPDLETLLEREKPDAVCIATRPSRMPGLAALAAARGVHVYLAKPAAVSPEGLAALEALRGSGVIFAAGPTARFEPAIRQAVRRIAEGQIGEITAVRIMHQHGMLRFWPENCWYRDRSEGGIGQFLGWYCIDLLHALTNRNVVDAMGMASRTADLQSPHPDVLKAVCSLEGGALGSFDVLFNVAFPYPMFEIEAIGTEGALRVQQTGYEGQLYKADGASLFAREGADTLGAELEDWVNACRGGHEPACGLDETIRNVRTTLLLEKATTQRAEPSASP